MARGYTVATVALAINADIKWVDNVLSHHAVPGVTQSRQGVPRTISSSGVLQLLLIRRLTETLRLPMELAVEGAGVLGRDGRWVIGPALNVEADREGLAEETRARLEYAVEAAPLPRRGRPPGKAKRGT